MEGEMEGKGSGLPEPGIDLDVSEAEAEQGLLEIEAAREARPVPVLDPKLKRALIVDNPLTREHLEKWDRSIRDDPWAAKAPDHQIAAIDEIINHVESDIMENKALGEEHLPRIDGETTLEMRPWANPEQAARIIPPSEPASGRAGNSVSLSAPRQSADIQAFLDVERDGEIWKAHIARRAGASRIDTCTETFDLSVEGEEAALARFLKAMGGEGTLACWRAREANPFLARIGYFSRQLPNLRDISSSYFAAFHVDASDPRCRDFTIEQAAEALKLNIDTKRRLYKEAWKAALASDIRLSLLAENMKDLGLDGDGSDGQP